MKEFTSCIEMSDSLRAWVDETLELIIGCYDGESWFVLPTRNHLPSRFEPDSHIQDSEIDKVKL